MSSTPDDDFSPDENGYELVERFVVVTSVGGKYDDESFVAGATYADFENDLKRGEPREAYMMPPPLVPQLDLTAMRYGYTTITESVGQDEHWVSVRVELMTPVL